MVAGLIAVLAFLTAGIAHAESLEELVRKASERHPRIAEAERALERARSEQKAAGAAFLPEVGAAGGWDAQKSPQDSQTGAFGYGYANWNLFRGFQDTLASRARGAEVARAELELAAARNEVERRVASAFYQLLYLDEALRLKQGAIDLNRKHSAMAEKRRASGITSRTDVLEFEFVEATLQSDLLLHRHERMAAERQLETAVGAPVATVEGELPRDSVAMDLAALLARAEGGNFRLRETATQAEVASLERRASLGAFLPSLDAQGRYGRLPITEWETTNRPVWDLQLKLTLPLFSGFSTVQGSRARGAEASRLEARLELERRESRLAVENLFHRLKALEERVELERKNIERARGYYEGTLSEYQRGIRNSADVAQAAERLYEAQHRSVEFARDLALGRVELAEAVGAGRL